MQISSAFSTILETIKSRKLSFLISFSAKNSFTSSNLCCKSFLLKETEKLFSIDVIIDGSSSINFNEIHLDRFILSFGRNFWIVASNIIILSSIIGWYLIRLGLQTISPKETFKIVDNNLSKVFLFLAVVPTTGTPKNSESFFKSISICFFLASSSKFTQTTTLLVISRVWNTRFKFFSIQVASKIITVVSGFPKQI